MPSSSIAATALAGVTGTATVQLSASRLTRIQGGDGTGGGDAGRVGGAKNPFAGGLRAQELHEPSLGLGMEAVFRLLQANQAPGGASITLATSATTARVPELIWLKE